MRTRLLLAIVLAVGLLAALAVVVAGQGEVPAPYAGLKNPLPWDDASAQEAGKKVYQQSCVGCHGAKGDALPQFNFSAADHPKDMETRPDYFLWVLSEGRLSKGMPPFKASLSETQRWQMLTYLWSLGKPAATPKPPDGTPQPDVTPVPAPPSEEGATLWVGTPREAEVNKAVKLLATLQDKQGKPIKGVAIEFFWKVDFFGDRLLAIGEAETDSQGIATLEFTPREAGRLDVVARYKAIETVVPLNMKAPEEPLYETEVGIKLPAPGKEVFIGPESAHRLRAGDLAPMTALRLPGGIGSWLWLFIGVIMLIWSTYFRVVFQVFRIPVRREIRDIDTRFLPTIGLGMVMLLGTMLVLMIITGPFSHMHLG
ncbi:MAG: c-type cytochrome [Chloroflexi bacterium]|nr:c-type cytochrome [Chloroflexota bacterium]